MAVRVWGVGGAWLILAADPVLHSPELDAERGAVLTRPWWEWRGHDAKPAGDLRPRIGFLPGNAAPDVAA